MATFSKDAPKYIAVGNGECIAYHHSPGKSPGVVFLPGFMSNMNGTKAVELGQFCHKVGHSYTRFDYRGHGISSGTHADCTVGRRTEDALAVLGRIEGKLGGRPLLCP